MQNRDTLKNGDTIQLASSPAQCSQVHMQRLTNACAVEAEQRSVLNALVSLVGDIAYASIFIPAGGMQRLLEMLRTDAW
jgi:hypothetical protein